MRSMVEGAATEHESPHSDDEACPPLRRDLTLPEVILWQALRRSAVEGLRFRRQHPIGSYILDFYCPARKLGIEIDGAVHDSPAQVAHDRRRGRWLLEQGIRIIRFNATDVLHGERRQDVLATIAAAVAPSTAFGGPPPPASRGRISP